MYFTQTLNGLDIENAQANVNVKRDGSILSVGSSFVTAGLDVSAPVRRNLLLDPLEALKGVVEALELPLKVDGAQAVPESSLTGGGQSFTIMGSEGAVSVGILIWDCSLYCRSGWLTRLDFICRNREQTWPTTRLQKGLSSSGGLRQTWMRTGLLLMPTPKRRAPSLLLPTTSPTLPTTSSKSTSPPSKTIANLVQQTRCQ